MKSRAAERSRAIADEIWRRAGVKDRPSGAERDTDTDGRREDALARLQERQARRQAELFGEDRSV